MSQKLVPWEGSWPSSLAWILLIGQTALFAWSQDIHRHWLQYYLSSYWHNCNIILAQYWLQYYLTVLPHLSPGLSVSPQAWVPHSTVSLPRGLMLSSHRSLSTIVLSLRSGVTCQHCDHHHHTWSPDTPRRQTVCPRPHRSRCTQRTPDVPS